MISKTHIRLQLMGKSAFSKAASLLVFVHDEQKKREVAYELFKALQTGESLEQLRTDELKLINGQSIKVDMINPHLTGADTSLNSELNHGYEPSVLTLLETYLPDNGVFYDVGANWGYFGFFTMLRPNFIGKIFSFEPMPISIDSLHQVLEQMPDKERMIICPYALGDRVGNLPIIDSVWSGGCSMNGASQSDLMVEVKRLDDLDLSKPDFIKIDVENFEAKVMRGACETIKNHRPYVIFESWKSDDPEITQAPIDLMKSLDYHLYVPRFNALENRQYQLGEYVPGEVILDRIEDRNHINEIINIFAIPAERDTDASR